MKKAWIFLILAIITEVLGTTSLKLFENEKILSYAFMGIFIIISYVFMGLAVKRISIGIAYAMWEALGIVLISLLGIFLFDETLSFYQKMGIIFSVSGIILINFGEEEN
ncbi:QacE family quaternary ammonium compound efflux SMR transporter [Helicobacter anseris]|uniref:Spermidine export protein MdtJ n=1 Tax=Helicobacter anseris TaxID=375926 RepID=A0A3D8J1X5_9HELI|nr:multidrug efflux SMR transporter [Helicobacter anseris]RDU71532.1 QacE family quaternary ammonium compound efflux SMR transporter [Helicobacter anseris]